MLLRRPSGFELHSVREYHDGESLRRVHWPSTARRQQLMVKELEDAPRDEVLVLLDAQAGFGAGTPPDSSFDAQVRVAGSILWTHARRDRNARLFVTGGAAPEPVSVRSYERDWPRAMEALAAAEQDGRRPLEAFLADEAGVAARASDVTIVTAALRPALVEALISRAVTPPASLGRLRRPSQLRPAGADAPSASRQQSCDWSPPGSPWPSSAATTISQACSERAWRAQLARTALLCLLPAALIATGWRQLEAPAQGRELALVTLLGVVVALLPRRSLQLAASVGALLVAVHLAFGLRPVGGIFSEFVNGLVDYYEVTLPFDPGDHARMHGVLLLAVFAFTLGASLAIARRRAVLAAAITFGGAAWPVTLIRDAPSTARGALLLVAALILLAALRPGARPRGAQTALVGGAVLLAALIAVSSPAVAKGGFLNWEQWEP